MDDVIIDNQPVSVAVEKDVTVSVISGRSFWHYLFHWLAKSLLLSLLLNIDFCLFAKAGNYSLFSAEGKLASEVIYISCGIFVVSLVLMFLVSFSRWLQNLVLALAAGWLVIMLLNQFALFDKHTFLSESVRIYFNEGAADFLDGVSDVAAALIAAVIVFIYLGQASRMSLTYFIGTLLLVNGYIIFAAYDERERQREFVYDWNDTLPQNGTGKKYVQILLPEAASYAYPEMINTDKNKKIEALRDVMLGFYVVNGFEVYPYAYAPEEETEDALAAVLNPQDKSGTSNLHGHGAYIRSWQFDRLNDKTDYLKKNQLAETFKGAGYKVSVYQSRGVNICSSGYEKLADRCVNKLNIPSNFGQMKLSVAQNTVLLLLQWLESTGITSNPERFYAIAGMVVPDDKMPAGGAALSRLYVIDSLQTLDVALKDIKQDKGNGAYFVYVDLPADMFVYNEFCMLKPVNKWLAKNENNSKNQQAYREAYAEQYTCLFGKLQNFMDELRNAKLDDKTVVVLSGIGGPKDRAFSPKENVALQFGSRYQTNMAIRDPLRQKFVLKEDKCSVAEVIKSYLFGVEKCREFSRLSYNSERLAELKQAVGAPLADEAKVNEAKKFFGMWYKYWLKSNNGERDSSGKQKAEKQNNNKNKSEEVKVIHEAPVAEVKNETAEK